MTKRTCVVDGCNGVHRARGYCSAHYQRWKVYGDPTILERPVFVPGECDVEGCSEARKIRQWCRKHYTRWQRHGDPTAGNRSPGAPLLPCSVDGCAKETSRIIQGMCVMHYTRVAATGDVGPVGPLRIIGDDEARFWSYVNKNGPVPPHRSDLGSCWLWKGSLNAGGYGVFSADSRGVMAHRWSYEYFVGPIAEGLQGDHLCHTRSCVNFEHIEPVTNEVNSQRRLWMRWAMKDSDGSSMQCFRLVSSDAPDADVDVAGYGVRFPDGSVAVRWKGDEPSTDFWPRIEHAAAEYGATFRIEWMTLLPRIEPA